jgi:hypothetical protein
LFSRFWARIEILFSARSRTRNVVSGFALVRERLNLGHALIRTIDESAALARMQRNVRRDHVKRIAEVESVESLFEVALDVVNVDRAAARRTRNRLSDQEQLVNGIELDIGPAELLLLAGIWQHHGEAGLFL